MNPSPENLRLVWIDLEMTGLNASTDQILEIAAVVTGPDLVPLASIERVIYQPDEVLAAMSDRVRRIHTENGLLEEVRASKLSRNHAERAVLTEIAEHAP